MKDILDMELNVMVHAIATIGGLGLGHQRAVLGYGGHALLYQIMRSVPALFDASEYMKKGKVGSK